jgi:hypothetical protein
MPIDSKELPVDRTWWIKRGIDDRSILTWEAAGMPVLFDGCTAVIYITDLCGNIVLQISTTLSLQGQIVFGTLALGTQGNIFVSLTSAATQGLLCSRYRWTSTITFPDGSKWSPFEGNVIVRAGAP